MDKKEYGKLYYQKNKDKFREYKKEYNQRLEVKKRTNERRKEIKYKKWLSEYRKKPNNKIRKTLSTKLIGCINGKKDGSILDFIGCSLDELKKWLELQFEEGMSWENHGEWHIDHIIPCCDFNLENKYEREICFNWLNLQPLWAQDNWEKSNKIFLSC